MDFWFEIIKYHKTSIEEVNTKIRDFEKGLALNLIAGVLLLLITKNYIYTLIFALLPTILLWVLSVVYSCYRYIVIPKNIGIFFYYANEYVRNLSTSLLGTDEDDEKRYEEGYKVFIEPIRKEDLSRHAYNLYVLNYYKNRFYLTLRRLEIVQKIIFALGLILSLV